MSLDIVSQKFLQAAFGAEWVNVRVEWWKCIPGTKKREPSTAGWSKAGTAVVPPGCAVYYSVGVLKGARRASADVGRVHVLVADDVGTKVDRDLVEMFMPWPVSAVVETSPGNFHYSWFVPEGMTVEEHAGAWEGMQALFGRLDGRDPGRLFRLPQGVNGKDDGDHRDFEVKLTYHSKARVTREQVVAFAPPKEARRQSAGSGGGQEAPSVEAVAALLRGVLRNKWDGVEAGARERWINTGMAIKGALPHNEEEAFKLWAEWSGEYETDDLQARWDGFAPSEIGWGWLEIAAKEAGGGAEMAGEAFDDGADVFGGDDAPGSGRLTMGDFWAYMPKGTFICLRDGSMWSDKAALNNAVEATAGVNAKGKAVLIPAADMLQRTRQVHQMSWMPGKPQIVEDTVVPVNGGNVMPMKGVRLYNLYVPPVVERGDAGRAGWWLAHVKKLYPHEWQHIVTWLAHRVQKPGEKINHALVLGGVQGIGKDFILEPMKVGVGSHNVQSIDPPALLGSFNGFCKAVTLMINEIHNLGDGLNPYRFYEQTKTLIAAPPNVLRVNEKYLGEYYIPNVVGVIMTTNHKLDGLYLDENDRRHFIAWSDVQLEDISKAEWEMLWQRMDDHVWDVVAYLREFDLSKFNAKVPPEKTRTWHKIVGAGNVDSQDEAIAEALSAMSRPDAFIRSDFMASASDQLQAWIYKASKPFANKLDGQGYERAINRAAKNGRHKIGGRPTTIYVRNDLSRDEQDIAVKKLIGVKEK